MSPRAAADAVVDSVGVVVACLIGSSAIVAAVVVALGMPAQSRADDAPPAPTSEPRPAVLVVGLDLRDPVRQAGVVRGNDVILARGLEVDIARDLARRLRVPRVKFVYMPTAARLRPTAPEAWHLVIASLSPTGDASAHAGLTQPYLGSDQAVVLRRGFPPFRSLEDFKGKIVCAVLESNGARAMTSALGDAGRHIIAPSQERLLVLVQTGVCDAALVDADEVGRFVKGRGGVLGPVTARVSYGVGSVVAVGAGGPLTVAEVDRALLRMKADGTMHRFTRASLGIDPARLRLLR